MQKKKHTKRILSAILAVIFAFAPIFFAGCNFNPDDSGGSSSGGSSGGGGTISTNYKIGDYLNSIKVSYSVSGLSADTQNEDIKEYANQIISILFYIEYSNIKYIYIKAPLFIFDNWEITYFYKLAPNY